MTIRNIIIAGLVGDGKSALANVLIGENKFIEIESSSYREDSETRHIKVEKFEVVSDNEKITYQVIELPGFKGFYTNQQQLKTNLGEVFNLIKKDGLNQILFVCKGRFNENKIKAFNWLVSVIFDKDENCLDYITAVETNCPDFENEKNKERANKSIDYVRQVLGRNISLLSVDNSPAKGYFSEISKKCREKSHHILLTFLLENCQKIYWPKDLDTLKKRISDCDKTFLKQEKNDLENLLRSQKESNLQQQLLITEQTQRRERLVQELEKKKQEKRKSLLFMGAAIVIIILGNYIQFYTKKMLCLILKV